MHREVFVGLDLAWADRSRTGLAVVGGPGALLDSVSLRSDGEITTWLDRADWAPVVIAIDAPLVVTNLTGARACEVAVSRSYGRFGASCHPANRSRPWFNPPRGQVLAQARGWNLEPNHIGTAGDPSAIEVYPHPAMVELFGLARIIPYKAKAGRTVAFRRDQFCALIEHMERIPHLDLPSSTRWAQLKAEFHAAGRQVDLDRIEDEIDAILCAHLAWLWHHDRGGMRQFGTGDAVIVIPFAPDVQHNGRPGS